MFPSNVEEVWRVDIKSDSNSHYASAVDGHITHSRAFWFAQHTSISHPNICNCFNLVCNDGIVKMIIRKQEVGVINNSSIWA